MHFCLEIEIEALLADGLLIFGSFNECFVDVASLAVFGHKLIFLL